MFDTYRRDWAAMRSTPGCAREQLEIRFAIELPDVRRVLDHVGNYGHPKWSLLSLRPAKRGDRGRLHALKDRRALARGLA